MAELEETDATVSPPVPAPPTPEDELELEVTEELVAVAHDPSVVSLLLHAAVRRAIIPKPIANRFISFPFRFLRTARGSRTHNFTEFETVAYASSARAAQFKSR